MLTKKISKIYLLSFLFSLHIALSAYVNSTFLTSIIPEKYVGLLFTIAAAVALLLLSKSSSILEYFGDRRLIIRLLIINMIALVGLIVSVNPYIIALSFILFSATNTLVFLCIDIFIQHFSESKSTGKIRGLYLTVINLAWMISPLITSYLITKEGGYVIIYILSFIAMVVMTIGLLFSVKTFKDSAYKKTPFIDTYRFLMTNKHMFAITMINFTLQFFYAWMVVYMPIYLFKHLGFNWEQIGVMFAFMLSAFVIFAFPIGILIDKFGVKKTTLLNIGFFFIVISTFLTSVITVKDIVIWSAILFLTRIGASIIESTGEIYLFTHIKEEDSNILGVYRDMTQIAYIVGPIIATLIFLVLPYQYLFLILSIFMLLGFYYIPKLKHNHPNEISH